MALGTVEDLDGGNVKQICILFAETTNNGTPMAASDPLTAGISTNKIRAAFGGSIPDMCKLVVKSTAGSGVMVVTLRLWEMNGLAATDWGFSGSGTGAAAGYLNNGVAYAETSTNQINRSEPVYGLNATHRIYVQTEAIGGTATAISVFLQAEMASARWSK